MKGSQVQVSGATATSADLSRPVCGIIMPISEIDDYTASHWADVRSIITDAAEVAGFDAKLVSDEVHVGIIHKRIVQNLYENPIVVCDVSAKNPNVMFELGLRLAFDKPTIVIKDDRTNYSFDTSPIEHLGYPRDLRYANVVDFKDQLATKMTATHKKAVEDQAYSTFLKHFGEFSVPKIDTKEVTGQEYIIEELASINLAIKNLTEMQSLANVARSSISQSVARPSFQIGTENAVRRGRRYIVVNEALSSSELNTLKALVSEEFPEIRVLSRSEGNVSSFHLGVPEQFSSKEARALISNLIGKVRKTT